MNNKEKPIRPLSLPIYQSQLNELDRLVEVTGMKRAQIVRRILTLGIEAINRDGIEILYNTKDNVKNESN